MEGIRERVIKVVVEKLTIKASELQDDTKFSDLGADSLGLVDLLMGLEDEFGLKIPDEDAKHISTLGETLEYIEGKFKEAEAASV
ncbi:MAG: acyl carrier protein [Patescibacteria group bacterium]|jgi:acyl carrier protein